MEINYVNGGEMAFNTLLYGPPKREWVDYLNNQMSHVLSNANGLSDTFVNGSLNMFNSINSDAAIEQAKNIVYNTGMHVSENILTRCTYDDIFNANLMTQRFIMASPKLYEYNQANRIMVFQDTYSVPDYVYRVEDLPEYRRAVDGMVQYNDDGEGFVMHYSDSYELDDLTTTEKVGVLESWDIANYLMADGIDPTDPDGGLI